MKPFRRDLHSLVQAVPSSLGGKGGKNIKEGGGGKKKDEEGREGSKTTLVFRMSAFLKKGKGREEKKRGKKEGRRKKMFGECRPFPSAICFSVLAKRRGRKKRKGESGGGEGEKGVARSTV